jgi:hypothetical protein
MTSSFTQWRVSTFSSATAGNCIEVGAAPGERAVRDTKLGSMSPILAFSSESWRSFVRSATSTLSDRTS